MKRKYLIAYVNGCIFPFALATFYENHNNISAFEHNYYLVKDILFVVVLLEQILYFQLVWKKRKGKTGAKFKELLKVSAMWLIGVVCSVALVVISS